MTPDDVGDGLRLDLPLRALRLVVEVTVEERVGVLVDRRRRQVGVVLDRLYFDDRRTPVLRVLSNTLRVAV